MEAGFAAGFAVEIGELRAAAAAFAGLHDDGLALLRAGGPAGPGGMAGRDPVLETWRARYDAVAAAQWAATAAAVAMLDALATKLAATAVTYRAADHPLRGAPGPDHRGAPSPTGAPAAPWAETGPPSATGEGGPPVPDALTTYFPGGDPSRLRAAAAAWSRQADGVDRIGQVGDGAFRSLLATGDGATFSAMRAYWARQFAPCATEPLLNAVVAGARTLSTSCASLADLIDHTRAAVRGAAAEAAHDLSPLELPALLLGRVAWDLPELELLIGTGALTVEYLNDYRNAYLFALDRLVEQLSAGEEQRLRRLTVSSPPGGPAGTGLTDLGRIAGLELADTRWDTLPDPHPGPDTIHITPERMTHVLVGDKDGGGHAPGVGRPSKSEFPRGWSHQQIIAAAMDVARSPDTAAPSNFPGRWIVTGARDQVLLRVIVDDDGSIRTAVPLSGPGVVTNPRKGPRWT